MRLDLNDKNIKNGNVLVVGAGIGGCQAALDLADLGFKVYLVEKRPSMSALINNEKGESIVLDCSSCLLESKLLSVKENPKIEIITNSDIVGLEGEPGNFIVKIAKKEFKEMKDYFTPCEDCIKQFLGHEPTIEDVEVQKAFEKYLQFPGTMSLKILLDKRRIPPCENACPAHVMAQEYNTLIAKKSYLEALEVIRERCPLPASIGRICTHPCETNCNRGELDEPVNICGLKRFVADFVRENLKDEIKYLEEKKDKKVAIVGSGPSGLTVAYQLARRGYPVTIFEKESVPGGMLGLCVPAYRLPPEILNADIEHIKKYGVEIKTNTPIGPPGMTVKDLLKKFDAVFIGVGLPVSRKLNIEGEDLENILYAIDFLKKCKLGKKVEVGKNVVVIGGGDVAIDVARTALRKGAEKVQMIMLESEDILPAHSWEVEEAKEEGIIFNFSRGPKRFVGKDGKVIGVETLICSSVFDENGRFNPVLEACTEEIFYGNTVIVAIGQAGDLSFLDEEIKVERGIVVDKNTFQTSMPGVFAGGEIVKGPGAAIEAMATGNKAALVIDKYLKGEDISKITETIPDYDEKEIIHFEELKGLDKVQSAPRNNDTLLPTDERKKHFKEISIGMNEETALKEASRCLNCGICSECLENVKFCVSPSIKHEKTDQYITLNVNSVVLSPGESWLSCFDLRRMTDYRWRILSPKANIEEDKCIGCGDCVETCPFEAIERIETTVEYNAIRDSYSPSISLIRYKSRINLDKCEGCGSCLVVCPVSAISMKYFTEQDLKNVLK